MQTFPDDWPRRTIALNGVDRVAATAPSTVIDAWVQSQQPQQLPRCHTIMTWAFHLTTSLIKLLEDPTLGSTVDAVMVGRIENDVVMIALCEGDNSYILRLPVSEIPSLCDQCAAAKRARTAGMN
jgi:hypothetical protein